MMFEIVLNWEHVRFPNQNEVYHEELACFH